MLAVVQLADDDRAVYVAIDKIRQHFGARAEREQGTPVGANARPSAATGSVWGMVF